MLETLARKIYLCIHNVNATFLTLDESRYQPATSCQAKFVQLTDAIPLVFKGSSKSDSMKVVQLIK